MNETQSGRPETYIIFLFSQDGEPLQIILHRPTLAQLREFSCVCKSHLISRIQLEMKEFPALAQLFESILKSIIASNCHFPSQSATEFSFSLEGMEVWLRILSRKAHEVEMPQDVIDHILADRAEDLVAGLQTLLPFLKRPGGTS